MTFQPLVARIPRLAGAALALFLATAPGAMAACWDPAGKDVNWSNCDKSKTNLSGANLTDADLRTAVMSGTNLSGANLTNADLEEVMGMSDTNMSGATWTDGRICAEGSIGVCN